MPAVLSTALAPLPRETLNQGPHGFNIQLQRANMGVKERRNVQALPQALHLAEMWGQDQLMPAQQLYSQCQEVNGRWALPARAA